MLPRSVPAFLFVLASALAWPVVSQGALASGTIWAAKVEGNAWVESAAKTRLVEGAKISAGSTIVTEANGNVVLLFENGSTINIRPGTKFSIKEFSCEPFDRSKVDYRLLRREASESSSTKVRVDGGSVIANVRKLRKGSTFDIGTPLGTAGIRGTTVYAQVNMGNAQNPVSFGVAEGEATFTANSGETRNIGGGSAIGLSGQGQFTPPPSDAQQMLSTSQQVGQTMMQVTPPAAQGGEAGAGGAGSGAAIETQETAATGPQSTGASSMVGGPVATVSEGTVTVLKDGAQSDGADNLNTLLAPGTIITTGEDGTITIEIAPGIVIQLQPNTQITIGERIPGKAVNENGDSIPEITIRLAVGSIVVSTTTEGLAGTSFVIETARGNISAVTAGSMVVSSTGADPSTATVTVAAIAGNKLAITTEGEQLPVAEGLVVILRPDGIEYAGIQDFPNLLGLAGV
ncbi:MAG: FecR domain-containing protein, partial [Chthoniobacterales bacterium]|nr:FecR domain-containing protein [Chthoniobacterales bacterium]